MQPIPLPSCQGEGDKGDRVVSKRQSIKEGKMGSKGRKNVKKQKKVQEKKPEEKKK